MAVHNEIVTQAGYDPVPTYHPDDFTRMLDAEAVDEVIVCTVDRLHADYIVAALDAGRDVITEKPMTADLEGCRRIYAAQERTGGRVTVGFNYRYNPVHRQLHTLLRSGVIGEIGSVHFEWLLDLRHGADYFRRWHRDKHNSGGLLVHKASHHFDLVNWWIGSRPTEVFAWGDLFFYGPENGRRHGVAADYERAHNSPAAENDPFALHLRDSADLTKLYLDAEHEDGYRRDLNVFGPGITIEDDMSVLVRYASESSSPTTWWPSPLGGLPTRDHRHGAASSLTSPNPRGPRRTRTRPHRYGACRPQGEHHCHLDPAPPLGAAAEHPRRGRRRLARRRRHPHARLAVRRRRRRYPSRPQRRRLCPAHRACRQQVDGDGRPRGGGHAPARLARTRESRAAVPS